MRRSRYCGGTSHEGPVSITSSSGLAFTRSGSIHCPVTISMSRIEDIEPELVDYIPATPRSGVLYVSRKYQTATHLCCCGCGAKVVTPLKPGGWKLTAKRGV